MTAALNHEIFMQRCIELATMGAGHVMPNPMVGAVLVYNGRIIGEGYHQQYGQAHAEVNCVNNVADIDRPLIKSSTMYVSLEPCAHHGKTPPCAHLIVREQIPHVVIGCVDTFSKVSGKGIEILKNAGIQVTTGILENACRELNKRFFTFHEQKRPYIVLKWSQSVDGFIGTTDRQPVKISNEYTDRLVHKWRSEEAAILVGTNTAVNDNPRLNTRLWPGNNPARVVIDLDLRIPPTHHIYDGSVKTFIVTTHGTVPCGATAITVERNGNVLQQMLSALHIHHVQSILIEGGAFTLQEFIALELWDEARIIVNEKPLGTGVSAPSWNFSPATGITHLATDTIYYHRLNTLAPYF
ncbi:diaminohydroxyphosphoribosylaminopyrimidine deaminase [Chitinophaga skermanii]|uniref:Riboflavin biosynthesis protein RibD n=1 Tax=Chitinophaga skermanii TaxID=331697 RepID=A0A327Q8R0_9BACT|nr:bifunctional diaminohydroxyphosphoribosylaminopyrimidine deaminase/5-amino-6-(5-phosphoribosylamino)uracil reductase RibD [Chitinophaga skermanii]RAJ00325.1 diaminohydroxyphosphoribosylaminopyrimidine deaminase [Chitinophaga skermanii]